MKKTATIILNRNLPEVTDRLYEQISKNDGSATDIFVLESGSDRDKLSKYYTWYADWPEAKDKGLRYQRGMNYSLLKLFETKVFANYEAFFLITNDTELEDKPIIGSLLDILKEHPRVGILSPCSQKWGEKFLFKKHDVLYFSFIHNTAYFLRREFIESIMQKSNLSFMNFLFDGANFRGFGSEEELIAKGYINDWAAAITNRVFAEENESYLIDHANIIKTEENEENMKLYIKEGEEWMFQKYGFRSKWEMHLYVKLFYDQFFKYHPECKKYKI